MRAISIDRGIFVLLQHVVFFVVLITIYIYLFIFRERRENNHYEYTYCTVSSIARQESFCKMYHHIYKLKVPIKNSLPSPA